MHKMECHRKFCDQNFYDLTTISKGSNVIDQVGQVEHHVQHVSNTEKNNIDDAIKLTG